MDEIRGVRPDPLDRRRFLLSAAVGLIVSACGGDDDPEPAAPGRASLDTSDTASTTSPPEGTSVPAATTASDEFPRTVVHGLGETSIPSVPRRIVATADRDQLDVLLAMDVRPVQYGRSGDYDTVPPWIDPASVEGLDAASMANPFLPNFELIAAARPDLILDAWADATIHDSLSAIAPTVQIKTAITDSWESAQRLAGQACGTEQAAEAAIATTMQVIADQAERLADHAHLRVAVAFLLGDQLAILTGTDIGGRIVAQLGFEVVSTPDGASGNFSLEQIPTLLGDADIILSFDDGELEAQMDNALFTGLPAVTSGGYVSVPADVAAACYQESTLSMRWAAAPVADALLRAATGRGDVPIEP